MNPIKEIFNMIPIFSDIRLSELGSNKHRSDLNRRKQIPLIILTNIPLYAILLTWNTGTKTCSMPLNVRVMNTLITIPTLRLLKQISCFLVDNLHDNYKPQEQLQISNHCFVFAIAM